MLTSDAPCSEEYNRFTGEKVTHPLAADSGTVPVLQRSTVMRHALLLNTWKRRAEISLRSASIQIVEGEPLPTEFRVFAFGQNTSTRGPALFDRKAAQAVMSEYERQGVDVMIDLEHLSLKQESRAYDPDARGWCKLELRDDGLWAVDVRWTPEGEARLREKRQRYISPAFYAEKETGRVVEVINIALCARPATHKAPALVAATRSKMDPAKIKEALEAIKNGDAAKALELLESWLVEMAGGVPVEAEGEGEEVFSDQPNAAEQAAVVAAMKKFHGAVALSKKLVELTGKTDESAAIEVVESWRTSQLELEEREAKVAKDRATLEQSERRKLVGELVKLGSETPATAWSDDKGTVPVKRLLDEPIAELRTRVVTLTQAKGKAPPKITPPGGGSHDLTPAQLEHCKRKKIDPEKYAENLRLIQRPSSAET